MGKIASQYHKITIKVNNNVFIFAYIIYICMHVNNTFLTYKSKCDIIISNYNWVFDGIIHKFDKAALTNDLL